MGTQGVREHPDHGSLARYVGIGGLLDRRPPLKYAVVHRGTVSRYLNATFVAQIGRSHYDTWSRRRGSACWAPSRRRLQGVTCLASLRLLVSIAR